MDYGVDGSRFIVQASQSPTALFHTLSRNACSQFSRIGMGLAAMSSGTQGTCLFLS